MAPRFLPQSTFVRRYLVVMSVLLIATGLAGMTLLSSQRVETEPAARPVAEARTALPILGTIDGFTLTDQEGDTFSAEDLRGHVYVADFIFTSCPGICPTMTAAMAGLHEAYTGNDRVRFVSITVDPETDTPEVLSWYAGRYDADPERWHFLTGARTDIEALARDQFLVGWGEEAINHSGRFILVDGEGRIRGFYHGTEPASVAALEKDLDRLLAST